MKLFNFTQTQEPDDEAPGDRFADLQQRMTEFMIATMIEMDQRCQEELLDHLDALAEIDKDFERRISKNKIASEDELLVARRIKAHVFEQVRENVKFVRLKANELRDVVLALESGS